MSGGLVYVDLRHDCDVPNVPHLPSYGEVRQVMAKWRCPECRQRWVYAASFLHHGRMYWNREGGPSRRWRKAEADRMQTAPGGGRGRGEKEAGA